ncbi:MAG: glycosyltransferase family 4 protein [Candidatus Azobacteroides sp.]|nr:glycosyltransferase family 4 protein [Candidatus Azobacteroides sp.]
MRIGFDGKRAVANYTGLGNYSRYILHALSSFYPSDEYILYAPKRKESPAITELQKSGNIRFVYPGKKTDKIFSSYWRTKGILKDLKKDKIDIFHGLSNEIPLGISRTGIKAVVSIHDLIFLRYPELYKPIDRKIYTAKFRYAARNSDLVIAISECTKKDLIHFFSIPEEKIRVVYQGCDNRFSIGYSQEEKEIIRKKYNLPEKFILNVGSMEARKNLLLAVRAMKDIDPEIHLVAVGKVTPYVEDIKKEIISLGLKERVHFFHQFPFSDLPILYQLASIFIYPSFFEGFGIPIIEALSSGIPVIAATGSCLEEAGGKDSMYVNPKCPEELSDAICKILEDETLYHHMQIMGKEYVKRFSPQHIAQDLMGVYLSLF